MRQNAYDTDPDAFHLYAPNYEYSNFPVYQQLPLNQNKKMSKLIKYEKGNSP